MVGRADPRSRLPAALVVDASERTRAGIRISLSAPPAPERPPAPVPVDCAGTAPPDVPLRALEFAVVDVETTGGSWSRGHRITEICAVRMRGDGTWLDEYRTLINPERPIPFGISALTNITYDMVQAAPRFHDVAAHVARALGGAVFVAHNAQFDWAFVRAELARAGAPLTGRTLCTVQLAKQVVPEIRRKSLDDLAWFFQIHNQARHRAYGDARATAEILRRLILRLDDYQVARWDELQDLLRRRMRRRRRVAVRAVQELLL